MAIREVTVFACTAALYDLNGTVNAQTRELMSVPELPERHASYWDEYAPRAFQEDSLISLVSLAASYMNKPAAA